MMKAMKVIDYTPEAQKKLLDLKEELEREKTLKNDAKEKIREMRKEQNLRLSFANIHQSLSASEQDTNRDEIAIQI